MYKTKIDEGIVRYSFDPKPGYHFADSAYALISDGKALLIDTGYEHEGAQIGEDLKDNGLELAGIIISHFHDDHMRGIKAFPGVPVYGSEEYKKTLDMWTEKEEHEKFIPSVIVKDTLPFNFGEHHICIIQSPGHSNCTVLVNIDDAYVHIADELLFSPQQEPILPVTDPGCIGKLIGSLNNLKSYSSFTLLPSHGLPLCGAEEIVRQIDKRLAYLNAVLNAKGSISYKEASKDSGDFLHSEWHSEENEG